MATNTSVKPATNPSAPTSERRVVRSPPPETYETYMGSMGSRQGEMKVTTPSRKETR